MNLNDYEKDENKNQYVSIINAKLSVKVKDICKCTNLKEDNNSDEIILLNNFGGEYGAFKRLCKNK